MPCVNIVRSSEVVRTPRVMQVESLFDVPPSKAAAQSWQVDFELPKEWNVGVIVGPSGAGKTTVARELFGDNIVERWEWPADKSLLDGFPKSMPVKDVVDLLSSVGFSSPPAWVKPFHVLSNGEQFRVHLARTLAEMKELAVVDEFTSVVDRQVAKVGSYAIQKTVRRRNQKLIAVTCHYDVLDWLEPDWVYQPHTNEFSAGRSVRRPPVELCIRRVDTHSWELFHKHHYLNGDMHKGARCYVAFWDGVPVAFYSLLHFPHPRAANIKRGHRMVCLPDYQGLGIGKKLESIVGSMCKALGYRFIMQSSHPAVIQVRKRDPEWVMYSAPSIRVAAGKSTGLKGKGAFGLSGFGTRLIASFEYIGAAMDQAKAKALWGE